MNIVQRRSSCYTWSMILRALWWLVKCVGLSAVGVAVCWEVTLYSVQLTWWLLYHAGATHFSRSMFGFEHFFSLRATFGFILGLIPLSSVMAAVRSMWARFSSAKETVPVAEDDWARPLLWAWMPVAFLLVCRFLSWSPVVSSVLSTGRTGERFEHFFNPMLLATLDYLSPSAQGLVFDYVFVTGPMVFMLAYTVGVWVRYQFPALQSPTEVDSIPLEEQPIEPH